MGRIAMDLALQFSGKALCVAVAGSLAIGCGPSETSGTCESADGFTSQGDGAVAFTVDGVERRSCQEAITVLSEAGQDLLVLNSSAQHPDGRFWSLALSLAADCDEGPCLATYTENGTNAWHAFVESGEASGELRASWTADGGLFAGTLAAFDCAQPAVTIEDGRFGNGFGQPLKSPADPPRPTILPDAWFTVDELRPLVDDVQSLDRYQDWFDGWLTSPEVYVGVAAGPQAEDQLGFSSASAAESLFADAGYEYDTTVSDIYGVVELAAAEPTDSLGCMVGGVAPELAGVLFNGDSPGGMCGPLSVLHSLTSRLGVIDPSWDGVSWLGNDANPEAYWQQELLEAVMSASGWSCGEDLGTEWDDLKAQHAAPFNTTLSSELSLDVQGLADAALKDEEAIASWCQLMIERHSKLGDDCLLGVKASDGFGHVMAVKEVTYDSVSKACIIDTWDTGVQNPDRRYEPYAPGTDRWTVQASDINGAKHLEGLQATYGPWLRHPYASAEFACWRRTGGAEGTGQPGAAFPN